MSKRVALFKIKKFKLVVSQQVLEIKRTWQEAEKMREFQITNSVDLTLAFLRAQKQVKVSMSN